MRRIIFPTKKVKINSDWNNQALPTLSGKLLIFSETGQKKLLVFEFFIILGFSQIAGGGRAQIYEGKKWKASWKVKLWEKEAAAFRLCQRTVKRLAKSNNNLKQMAYAWFF